MLSVLKDKNPDLKIYDVSDDIFNTFGRTLDFSGFKNYIAYLDRQTVIPKAGNIYVANEEELKKIVSENQSFEDVFGNMPLQYGYVNGKNSSLNALEYHKSSEINIALTSFFLILGKTTDIHEDVLDSKDLIGFYVPAQTAIELYPMTLHFSPCKVSDEGFKCGVVLPYGTNMQFVRASDQTSLQDRLLFKTNKWLLAHIENRTLLDQGAYPGIVGKNIEIKY